MLNESNCRTINALTDEVNFLRETNTVLLKKLGIIQTARNNIAIADFKPMGGYTSLRTRIRELEAKSREEAKKELENEEEKV